MDEATGAAADDTAAALVDEAAHGVPAHARLPRRRLRAAAARRGRRRQRHGGRRRAAAWAAARRAPRPRT